MRAKSVPEIEFFVKEHRASAPFWLERLEESIQMPESEQKKVLQQNAHDKLKAYIKFLES